jgi:flagellum-specific peptidoglycan hydrolase FlgJ
MDKQAFINIYYPPAQRATAGTGLFADTLITQMVQESGYDLSGLAKNYYNFFGIKDGGAWNGKVVSLDTKEQGYSVSGTGKMYSGRVEALKDGASASSLFRVYGSVEDGFKGWVNFLKSNPRYAKVFQAKTPQDQFNELKAAGYATENSYVSDLNAVYNSLKSYFGKAVSYVKSNPKKSSVAGVTIIVAGMLVYYYFFIYKNRK